jgi:thioredoxin-related protein
VGAFLLAPLVLQGPEAAPTASKSASAAPAKVTWQKLDKALAAGAKSGKPTFLMVQAEWCGYCHRMMATTFKDPNVVPVLSKNYQTAVLDGESGQPLTINKQTMTESQWAMMNGVQGFPSLYFFDPKGRVITVIPGYVTTAEFQPILQDILAYLKAGGLNKQDFNSWMAKKKR